ncbi:serine/threonine-protein kinase [Streptomyces sp. A012304]|uniref:serine/threonine-protein kinase n=1 Tax=Streptomyces sp. A012304 TaxID=375446 RepID=UPI0022314AAF|nr:serine/threonine-protein kinase [Streptomyces sp. A012304]GKQ37991.1 serine/threonine protein kinase [Streptomyces sp. A012304]
MPLNKDDPRSLGGYRIVDRLGAGGMGVVYRARSRSGREVAVKVVHAQYAEDGVFRTRFRQEIEAARRVSGAFTAPVVDADPEAVRPWMATQYVPAPSLAARIRADGPLRGVELRRLALGLVEALRDIHRAGVVHRDLKPGNVLMAEDGPRVIDFGISRATENQTLTETGHAIGTPPFMSPEQFADARSVGPASDVFSLGALLVFAATGRGPFDADSPYLTAYRVINEEPALDAVAEPLRGILARCLAKEPAERPGLEELGREFVEVLPEPAPDDAHTVTLRLPAPDATRSATFADPESVSMARRSRPRRLPVLVGAAGVLAVALAVYLVLGPLKGGGRAETGRSATPSATQTSRWGTPPAGWRPWQTTVNAPAARGEKPLRTNGTGTPECKLSEGALYCGGDGVLPVRLDALTGKAVWRAASMPAGADADRYASWILGVHDGRVLVYQTISSESGDSDTTALIALDAGTGDRAWSRAVDDENADLAVAGDLVLTPDSGASITARSPRDGKKRWTATLPRNHYCSFSEFGGRPYADCSSYDEDGASVAFALDPADGRRKDLPPLPSHADPVGELGGRMIFAQWREESSSLESPYTGVVSVDPDTGARRTTKFQQELRGTASLTHGMLCFAGSSGQVTCVSPTTGKVLWQTATTLEQPGEPIADPQGRTVFVASASGRVAALDARTGTLLWESYPRADVVNGGFDSPDVFVLRGTLVVATPDGTVFGMDPARPDRKPASG